MANDVTRLVDRHELLQFAMMLHSTTKADLQVLAVIECHANHKQDFASWPNLETIMRLTTLAKATVIRSIRNLVDLGLMDVVKNGKFNVYYIELDKHEQVTKKSPMKAQQVTKKSPITDEQVTNDATTGDKSVPITGDQIVTSIKATQLKEQLDIRTRPKSDDLLLQEQQQHEQQEKLKEQQRLADEQRQAEEQQRRESLRAEYLQSKLSHPKHALGMERTFRAVLADLIEEPKP